MISPRIKNERGNTYWGRKIIDNNKKIRAVKSPVIGPRAKIFFLEL
jgi:hypothetical protein